MGANTRLRMSRGEALANFMLYLPRMNNEILGELLTLLAATGGTDISRLDVVEVED